MMGALKQFVGGTLGLPSWALLAAAGLVLHLAACLLFRRPPTWAGGLLAPLLAVAALEGYEIWDAYRHVGLHAPGNDPVARILLRHAGDVARAMALPVVLVVAGVILNRN